MQSKLDNYLRTYRRRSGLSQREAAFLMGFAYGGQVGRYERRDRLPPLETALAYQTALGVPLEKLFVGIQERITKEVKGRLEKLRLKLESSAQDGPEKVATLRKLQWLRECQDRLECAEITAS
jgi:transcriptional regulator with XRE-family HTH domain